MVTRSLHYGWCHYKENNKGNDFKFSIVRKIQGVHQNMLNIQNMWPLSNSETCLQRPPKGNKKSGLYRQVVLCTGTFITCFKGKSFLRETINVDLWTGGLCRQVVTIYRQV